MTSWDGGDKLNRIFQGLVTLKDTMHFRICSNKVWFTMRIVVFLGAQGLQEYRLAEANLYDCLSLLTECLQGADSKQSVISVA